MRTWVLAVTTACLAAGAVVGPVATASADCSTLVECVVEQTQTTIENAVTQVEQEAACVQGQISSPNPSAGGPVCQTAGTIITTANDTAEEVPQEPDCLQSQVTSPSPSRGGLACRTVGTALTTANGEAAYVEGQLASAQQQAEQEALCLQGQLDDPDPSRGSPVCQAVGTAITTARDLGSEGSIVCVLQGRFYRQMPGTSWPGTIGRSDCAMPGQGHRTGTFDLSAYWVPGGGGYLSGSSACCTAQPFWGSVTAGGISHEVNSIQADAPGQLPQHPGTYSGTWRDSQATVHPAKAFFHGVPASTIDPAGGSDYFVNGYVELTR